MAKSISIRWAILCVIAAFAAGYHQGYGRTKVLRLPENITLGVTNGACTDGRSVWRARADHSCWAVDAGK